MRSLSSPCVVCTVGLAGCGDDDASGPATATDLPTKTIEITFEGDSVTPNGERVEVEVGQPIELVVKADAEGEIHVHSDPEQELAYGAGTTTCRRHDRQAGHRRRRVARPGEDVVQLEVEVARAWIRLPLDDVFAHGIGGSKDLPIPLELAIAGAVAALTVSFTVLAVAWRTPRYDAATSGRPAPAWLARIVDRGRGSWSLRGPSASRSSRFTAMAAVLGKDSLINPFFGIFYVLVWVGLVPVSLLFGPVYKAISPVRTINAAVRQALRQRPRRGRLHLPRAARATGRRRSASSRSCGSSWSTRSPPSWARCGCGARRTSRRC